MNYSTLPYVLTVDHLRLDKRHGRQGHVVVHFSMICNHPTGAFGER